MFDIKLRTMKKIVFIALTVISCACSNIKQEQGVEIIPLGLAFEQPGEISVKDVGSHIDYVPLETTDESLIGDRAYIRILKDKLLVGSREQPVKMFDRKTGKFIR